MNRKKFYVSLSFLASIVFTQESIPFDISKQFAVPLENNQLIWNSDISFNNLLMLGKAALILLSSVMLKFSSKGTLKSTLTITFLLSKLWSIILFILQK